MAATTTASPSSLTKSKFAPVTAQTLAKAIAAIAREDRQHAATMADLRRRLREVRASKVEIGADMRIFREMADEKDRHESVAAELDREFDAIERLQVVRHELDDGAKAARPDLEWTTSAFASRLPAGWRAEIRWSLVAARVYVIDPTGARHGESYLHWLKACRADILAEFDAIVEAAVINCLRKAS
jgi:hypothetical protein